MRFKIHSEKSRDAALFTLEAHGSDELARGLRKNIDFLNRVRFLDMKEKQVLLRHVSLDKLIYAMRLCDRSAIRALYQGLSTGLKQDIALCFADELSLKDVKEIQDFIIPKLKYMWKAGKISLREKRDLYV